MIVDESFSRLTTRTIVHDSSSVSYFSNFGQIAVRKHVAALSLVAKIHTFTSLSYGRPFSIHIFTRKELGTRCPCDFACATAGEL